MDRKSQDFQKREAAYEAIKKQYKSLYKKKADILTLKKNPDQPTCWPLKFTLLNNESINGDYVSKLSRSRPTKRLKVQLYNDSYESYKAEIMRMATTMTRRKKNILAEDFIDEFVSHFLTNELKPKPRTEMNEKAVEFIQDASVDLIDNVLLNMVNSHTEGEGSFDWEFTMGNLLSLGLPTCVTDRVKRRMESTTGKNVPAITAMMVTRPSLSDLTITSAEVEMKKEIEKLIIKNERFESLPEDQPFEDSVKWLMDLDKKDQCAKDKETEKIHQDYTTRILDYKPAFF